MGLRALGYQIHTASINPPDRARSVMEDYERDETDGTLYVKAQGVLGALSALIFWGFRAPVQLARLLGFSLHLGTSKHWWFGVAYAVEALIVARWMVRKHIRHLHVHFGSAGATVGILVKRISGCHLSYTIHGPDEFDDINGQHLPLKMHMADVVICISQFAKGQLMRISNPVDWTKFKVCRLGVDPLQFVPNLAKSIDPQGVQLLSVGRLTPAKGQLLLIEACARLRDVGRRFQLTVIGDGPDRPRIEAAIQRWNLGTHVRLTGALNQLEVRQAFASADVFVLPSLAEGIPVVLMEAMASGVPCISTPVNGIPELIEHRVTGLLAVPGDVDSLTAQLDVLIEQPASRQALAERARLKVKDDFDLARNVRQLGAIFADFDPTGAR